MIQASDCGIFRRCIENAGKCGLAETGKHPVNENDEAMPHATLRVRQKEMPGDEHRASAMSCRKCVETVTRQTVTRLGSRPACRVRLARRQDARSAHGRVSTKRS